MAATEGLCYGIVGGRDFTDYAAVVRVMRAAEAECGPLRCIVSGGAGGADKMGERYGCEEHGLGVVEADHEVESLEGRAVYVFKPKWRGGGDRTAGLERNTLIAAHCDVLVAFPAANSRGTWDTVRKAERLGKRVIVHREALAPASSAAALE